MPRISLTDFVDIVSKSGTPKATNVARVKNRPEYSPATDYYKQLRDHIVELHRNNRPKADLFRLLMELTDKKKLDNYRESIEGYKKWWGRKNTTWFSPPNNIFSANGVDVSVNPELGLTFDGESHIVKLYFKADSLSKNRVYIITHLMEVSLRRSIRIGVKMSVLDVRNGKLITPTVPIATLTATLNAELAYIAVLWPNI